ncbi:DUF981 family protein [Candidatus Woesearchaeota archaeon]|nr:DUF981 family protein [Candidatus Woesearchaeota archaeon]
MAYNPLAFSLMLVSMGALIFSAYFYLLTGRKLSQDQEKAFGSIFIILGVIAGIFGFSIYFYETLPAQYIEIYALGLLIFAMLQIALGLSMAFGWDKVPASYLAAVCGIALLNSARTVYSFSLSKSPSATTALFGVSGLGCLGVALLSYLGAKKMPRWLAFLVLSAFVIVGLLALYSGVSAQYGHVSSALAKTAGA